MYYVGSIKYLWSYGCFGAKMWPFKTKDGRSNNGREFTEEDLEKSHRSREWNEIHRQRMSMMKEELSFLKQQQEERIMQQRLKMARGDFDDDEDDEDDDEDEGVDEQSPDAILMQLLSAVLANRNGGGPSAPVSRESNSSNSKATLSDEQLYALKDRIPKTLLKTLQKKSDKELLELGKMHYPDYFEMADEDTKQRALAILKGKT